MTLAEKLAAARTAYHSLVTGGSVRVFVDQNGERVEYTVGRKTDLYNYIKSLESELAGFSQVLRPFKPFF